MSKQTIKPKGKVFRDPVHRLIRIDPEDAFILDLVNSKEFQRLRRVRQLGVSSLTYHGAEHSRFVHSLGVYNFANKIISILSRRYKSHQNIVDLLAEDRRIILAAALLHDIGHGPFSHMIERADGSSFDHEKMTSKLIKNEAGDISKILISHEIDPQNVASIIEKTWKNSLAIDIVSSQLDADRMDYLLRDSHMTGVEYGVYDAEWLLNSMCIGLDPYTLNGDGRTLRLCLDKNRGLFAAEQLILARHHMMLQVYMHRVTRGYEVMLLNLFQHAGHLHKCGEFPGGTPPSVNAYFDSGLEMDLSDWLMFDETAMVAAFQAWSRPGGDPVLSRFSEAFLCRNRIFEPLSLSAGRIDRLLGVEKALADAGLQKNIHWGLDNGEHLPYKGVYHKSAKGSDLEEQSALSILLSDGELSSRGSAVENQSDILKGLDNNKESILRLYIDREMLEKAKPALKTIGI